MSDVKASAFKPIPIAPSIAYSTARTHTHIYITLTTLKIHTNSSYPAL